DVFDFIIPIAMALVITLIHFIGEKISEHMKSFHFQLQSFGAGLMVGIIFMELLPHIATGQEHLDEFIYIPFLFGFTIIALVEKIVYRRLLKKQNFNQTSSNNQNQLTENSSNIKTKDDFYNNSEVECISTEQNALFEGVAFISHGLVIGLLIALIFETYENIGYIVLIPFFIRALTLAFSTEQVLEELTARKARIIRIISSFTPTLGALIGIFMVFNKILLYTFFALTIGLILYIVVRDMIPLGKKGKPLYFILGVLLAIVIFLIFELVIF
ncbi:MAG: hypothetical protein FK731_13705, partial [Asgard group archaeon]|nr:hypothetical protein [Asgard group archaeon]